jgi:pyruvate dehydrogenase E2 component (dihydrolipoamide acetyltransferase)
LAWSADVVLPQMGLEVSEGRVTALHVAAGDHVSEGDALVEVETDKAVTDVEAPHAGVVVGVEVEAGDTVPVGATLIRLREAAEDGGRGVADSEAAVEPAAAEAAHAPTAAVSVARTDAPPGARLRAAPVARRAALHHGIPLEEIAGSGPRGRITLRDVARVARERDGARSGPEPSAAQAAAAEWTEPLSPTRLAIARRMTQSQEIPQFTLTRDVDAGWLLAEKARLSEEGPKVGVVDLLVQALAETVARHRELAASFLPAADGEPARLLRREGVDVGLAVATERGLLVPVIRRAHERLLRELALDRARLTDTARNGRLQLDEMSGATVTLSSLGTFGVDRFTAMLNPGESAILAAGRTLERVVPRDRGLAVVPTMALTFTFDHRVVDGVTGALALAELAELVEGAMRWRT